jgi:superfamily II DNA/RNA helicase
VCLSCVFGAAFLPACSENIQSRSLTAPLEVLVATPTRLTKVLEHGRVALGDVRW